MWFGTENGLNSFNGYEFRTYYRERGNADSLSSDFVFDVAEDASGNLWIATNGGGLAYRDSRSGVFSSYRHDAENDELDSAATLCAAYWWIATAASGQAHAMAALADLM